MVNTRRLPTVEAEFNILAPPGGFRRQLRSFDLKLRSALDIEIVGYYGNKQWLRVSPVRDEVILDPDHSEIYLVNKAYAVYINHVGGEELRDQPPVEVWMSIDTGVQAVGMPAGKLKMWRVTSPD